jgi:hypothetical protein
VKLKKLVTPQREVIRFVYGEHIKWQNVDSVFPRMANKISTLSS